MSIAVTYQSVLLETDELNDLIRQCAQNKRSAQERIYHIFYGRMMAMVKRYFPQQENAEEILNNGFLRAFQKMNSYQFKGSFEGWLRRIVFHAISDYVKSHVKYTQNNTTLEDKEYFITAEDSDGILYQDILKLIHELPNTSRIVFNMHVMEGIPHKKIGELLNISEGTSKWHLSEARKLLQHRIKELKLI